MNEKIYRKIYTRIHRGRITVPENCEHCDCKMSKPRFYLLSESDDFYFCFMHPLCFSKVINGLEALNPTADMLAQIRSLEQNRHARFGDCTKLDPDIKARQKIAALVSRGRITKPNHCEICRTEKKKTALIVRHTDGHNKPYNFLFCCRKCMDKELTVFDLSRVDSRAKKLIETKHSRSSKNGS